MEVMEAAMMIYSNLDKLLDHLALTGAQAMSPELLMILRVLVFLTTIIVVNAQLRSWRPCDMNTCRWLTVAGWIITGIGIGMSAVVTAQLGKNAMFFQVLIDVGLMLRLTSDIANAGRRRAVRAERAKRLHCRTGGKK